MSTYRTDIAEVVFVLYDCSSYYHIYIVALIVYFIENFVTFYCQDFSQSF